MLIIEPVSPIGIACQSVLEDGLKQKLLDI